MLRCTCVKHCHVSAVLQALLSNACTAPTLQVDCLVEFLWASHMLKSLQPSMVRAIAQAVQGRIMKEGETVYTQGDESKHFFLVAKGIVAILDTEDDDDSSGEGLNGSAAEQ